ncbi:MAG TPA: type III glutamate--ammonia ligase [Burkholderiaceae bacterium]
MKALRESLAAAGVHSLLVQFTDLHGVAKGKLVPLAHLDNVLAVGAGFSGPSICGTGLARTGTRSEYMARGAASTAMPLPWWPGVARIVGDGFVADEPFDACPRQVLKRAVARLTERRLTLQVGIEPEFFLLKQEAGRWQPADAADRLCKPSYDLQSLVRQLPFLRELHEALERCGLDVLQIDHEDAQGQYEVNFAFAEALATADHLMLFKVAAQALAERHGMAFSMMPKPFTNQPGSGMHCHVSLWQGHKDDSRNVFVPHRADGSIDPLATLSPLGGHFIAGVLAHAGALTALAAPTVNSYKRLTVGESLSGTTWAPAYVAHGPNNRTALVRTLHGRFEWRAPDASANPYLMLAGLIAAGLDGIERELDPGPACDEDLFTLTRTQIAELGLPLLPQTLAEAVDALEADATVCGALGDTLTREFVALKRQEHLEHARHVSDWELQRYATAF